MLRAYRLVYTYSHHAPPQLWEWEQPYIDNLILNARTFERRIIQWWFEDWEALDREGIHIKRDTLLSIAYSKELRFPISATLQSTDRHHGIGGQEHCHFQRDACTRQTEHPVPGGWPRAFQK